MKKGRRVDPAETTYTPLVPFGRRVAPAVARLQIDAVCALLACGQTYGEAAQSLGVTALQLAHWINSSQARRDACAYARAMAGTYWDDAAEEVIGKAKTAFQLSKANSLANHYRWRAQRLSGAEYGERSQVQMDTSLKIEVVRFGNDPTAT